MSQVHDEIGIWISDLPKFFREVLGFNNICAPRELTMQQRGMLVELSRQWLIALKVYNRTPITEEEQTTLSKRGVAVTSGQGCGKTGCIAGVILAFMGLFSRVDVTIGAVIGLKKTQLDTGIWHEFQVIAANAQKVAARLGVPCILDTMLVVKGETIRAIENGKEKKDCFLQLKTASRSPNSQGGDISGMHGVFQIWGIDEAAEFNDATMAAIIGGLTSSVLSTVMMSSNPLRNYGYFRLAFRENSLFWNTHVWSAEESPLVPKAHCEALAKEYGRDSNTYRTRVLGLFPVESADSLFDWDNLHACMEEPENPTMTGGKRVMGIDLAFGGHDDCALVLRAGRKIIHVDTLHTDSDPVLIHWIVSSLRKWKPHYVVVDGQINGKAIVSRLQALGFENTIAVLGHSSPMHKEEFFEMRDELWYRFSELVRTRSIDLSVFKRAEYHPMYNKLMRTIQHVKLANEKGKGKISINSNKITKKFSRGYSTDIEDALCFTLYYDDEVFTPVFAEKPKSAKYDPYHDVQDFLEEQSFDWQGA